LTRITPKSLRFRLVLWVIAILCCIQLVLGTAFYLLTSNWLQGQLDNSLSATAAQISAALQAADFIDDGRVSFQLSDEPAASFLQQRLFFVRIIDQQQRDVIDSSAPYAIEVTTQAATRNPVYETLALISANDTPMRVYTLPLEEVPLALQVGVSMTEVIATQTQILHMIAASLVVTLFLAGGSGLFWRTGR
jgi:hypothetical protein